MTDRRRRLIVASAMAPVILVAIVVVYRGKCKRNAIPLLVERSSYKTYDDLVRRFGPASTMLRITAADLKKNPGMQEKFGIRFDQMMARVTQSHAAQADLAKLTLRIHVWDRHCLLGDSTRLVAVFEEETNQLVYLSAQTSWQELSVLMTRSPSPNPCCCAA